MKYLTYNDLCQRYGVSRWTLMRWIERGEHPKPIKFSKKTIRFPLDEIEKWEKEKLQER